MGRIINVVIYCKNGKGRYTAYFEETDDGDWIGVRSQKMPEITFFEKLSLKAKSKLNSFSVPKGSGVQNFSGGVCAGNLKCPTCGNTSFLKCPSCGEMFCWNWVDNPVICPICSYKTPVDMKGKMKDINANVADSRKG